MGPGDNDLHGAFQIFGVEFGSDDRVNSFAADFEQWDEYVAGAWNRGSIHHNYNNAAVAPPDPVTPTPEPGPMELGLLATSAHGLVLRLRGGKSQSQ